MNTIKHDPIRVLIADDEPAARTSIEVLLKGQDDFCIVGCCKDGHETEKAILDLRPDLVLLDIQMPDKNGFAVLEAVCKEYLPQVIFITAYDQYAIKAFEKCALDYLLKPYDDQRFFDSLQRAKQLIAAKKNEDQIQQVAELIALLQQQLSPAYATRLPIKQGGRIIFLPVEDIHYIESEGNFVKVFTANDCRIASYNFKKLELLLNPQQFIRIHKSFIVNLNYIEAIEPYFHGDYFVILKTGRKLKLSRSYKASLDKMVMP